MGQTVRRQPGEVNIPKKDYIYHKNLIGFKGLDTRENPLVTDPLSCSDAENVWVDDNGNLTTRPRLQYVRQNLKYTDAEVANVIYTDNAYWTVYIKDSRYYLTRTNLVTNTEIAFTIPTITSAKIAITEYENVYYLGCSAGYYSCNAGSVTFQQVSGYIPVGHLGESGYIYDEARNILNNRVRIQVTMPQKQEITPSYATVDDSCLTAPLYIDAYIVYSQYVNPIDQISLIIYDIRRDVEIPLTGIASPTFSAFIDGNELIIVSAGYANTTGSQQATAILRVVSYNTVTYEVKQVTQRYIPLRALLLTGMQRSDANVYSGSGEMQGIHALYVTKKYVYVSLVYLQWDAANGSIRGTHLDSRIPTADTGQFVEQAIALSYSDLVSDMSDTELINRNRVMQLGVTLVTEHASEWMTVVKPYIPALYTGDIPVPKAILLATQSDPIYPIKAVSYAVGFVNGGDALTRTVYSITEHYRNLYLSYFAHIDADNSGIYITDCYKSGVEYILRRITVALDLNSSTESKILSQICDTVFIGGFERSVEWFTRVSDANYILFQRATTDSDHMIVDYTGNIIYLGKLPILLTSSNSAFQAAVFTASPSVIALHNTGDIYTINYLWLGSYFDTYPVPGMSSENPSLRGVLFLDNVYWWFGKTNIYGTANEDLTYMPESRKLDAPSEIRNWVRLTDTSFLVFCESDTCLYYKDTSSGLWLRTVLNLPFEILYPDETSESCYAALNTGPTYVTRNGIYEIALSENLFTNERQAQNISDPLTTLQGGLLRKLIPNIVHLQTVRYKDWQLYIFTRANATKTEVIAQEITTYNFFYWTLPIVFQAVYLAHSQVYIVTKKATTYTFSEAELLREYKNGDTVLAAIKCYGDEVYDVTTKTTSLNQIDWHWHSAVINLDTVQYYKTLLALIFGMNDYDDESRIMFEYRTDIYYKSHTEQPTQVYDDYVYKIRATQKPVAIPRFMYIRVRLSSVAVPENEDGLPEEFMCKVNLSQLTFKYKVLRGPLL